MLRDGSNHARKKDLFGSGFQMAQSTVVGKVWKSSSQRWEQVTETVHIVADKKNQRVRKGPGVDIPFKDHPH